MQDASQVALDFDAVQRGDAKMENKMNCGTLRENPIVSIHDQGAGGNVLKREMSTEWRCHPQPGGVRSDHVGCIIIALFQR